MFGLRGDPELRAEVKRLQAKVRKLQAENTGLKRIYLKDTGELIIQRDANLDLAERAVTAAEKLLDINARALSLLEEEE